MGTPSLNMNMNNMMNNMMNNVINNISNNIQQQKNAMSGSYHPQHPGPIMNESRSTGQFYMMTGGHPLHQQNSTTQSSVYSRPPPIRHPSYNDFANGRNNHNMPYKPPLMNYQSQPVQKRNN